eukprot:TRINITY_DN2781_c0_g1_i6.p1 TRINITY_DN2781_c0_g1~~TRINITY_DN2781_c0_g1_i6.p1  ORF type:complete len:518 (+),score=36.93 TRINITY_DN2781_c0_g1_i6:715-2268(+)
MKEPKELKALLIKVFAIISSLYIIFPILCYSAYGGAIRDIVLLNLPMRDGFYIVLVILYALAAILSYPIQIFPALNLIENYRYVRDWLDDEVVLPPNDPARGNLTSSQEMVPKDRKRNRLMKRMILRIFLLIIFFTIAYSMPSFNLFLNIAGSLLYSSISFVIPAVMYTKFFGGSLSKMEKLINTAVIVLGSLFGLVGFIHSCLELYEQWRSLFNQRSMEDCVSFFKYEALGNDFIMIHDPKSEFPVRDQRVIKNLCSRRFGIGADGLILLRPADGYDFEMVYFNSDGCISSFCGNGGRAVVLFARNLDIIRGTTNFLAYDGPHFAEITDSWVTLKMIDVKEILPKSNGYFTFTGSPHFVVFVDDVDSVDIVKEARQIRNNEEYAKEGVNVNFVQVIENDQLKIRTYERGVEDETYACGTGATACAIVHAGKSIKQSSWKVSVQTKGGPCKVSFNVSDHMFANVKLEGPARYVFEGKANLSRFLVDQDQSRLLKICKYVHNAAPEISQFLLPLTREH